jgi:predicted dehydrogenase
MFMDYANGIIGDWGVHWLDQILMWSEEKGPRSVFSAGSRPLSGPPVLTPEKQTTDAPEVQTAIFQFENFTATWENRRFGENESEKHPLGVCFYGTSGTLHIGWRDGWTFYPAKKGDPIIHENHQLQEPDGHNLRLLWDDFLKAIDSKTSPVANLEAAHRSSLLPMLANASMKLGRSITWNPDTESIADDPAASALLSRKYRGPWEYPA